MNMNSTKARPIPLKLLAMAALLAPLSAISQKATPLTIHAQGSFFVGGDNKTVTEPAFGPIPTQSGDITVNQMYVQYQVPMKGARHVPVVMIHGCCLSSKTWETTPDGRMGWSEYFVRKDRSVYLADQVSRARSGFDPTTINDVRLGNAPAAQLPGILGATHQVAWTVFRFGPKFGETFPDEQFPVQALDEFYKQMIPDLNATLPQNPNPTWTRMAALGVKLGGAILMGHSESGFFPEHAALIDPRGIRGIISIEPQCETDLTSAQIGALAKIPTLIMFGDHLGDVVGQYVNWMDAFANCNTFVDQLEKAGGDAGMMHLPALGIKGNSHMLMQDKNSDQLADLLIAWIDRHVEAKKSASHSSAGGGGRRSLISQSE
jgi:pimeloyl-ACP methyl ester carboxylesterase